MAIGGAVLKIFSTLIRAVQFLDAIAILGIFSYFLVYLHDNNLEILTWVRAVEGLSGAAALYTLVAFFLTCCLGGLPFFAFVAIVLDLAFFACFVAVTVLTKGGNQNCSSIGPDSNTIYSDSDINVSVDQDTAIRICDMYKATFVLAIIEFVLFLFSALFQFFLGRHHQREKRQGAHDPAVTRQPFWRRRARRSKQREMEQGAVPVSGYNY